MASSEITLSNLVVDTGSSNRQSSANHSAGSTQTSSKDCRAAGVTQRNEHHDSDSDRDVPRRRSEQRHDDDSDSDISPLRAGRRHSASSGIPAVRARDRRHDSSSDSDLSPVRVSGSAGQRFKADSDQSPKRAGKRSSQQRDSDSDLSPPRAREQAALKAAKVVSHRHDSDSDLSPPRTKNSRSADLNVSPVHQDQNSSHSSRQKAHHQRHRSRADDPQQMKRKACKQDSDGDLSPKRRPPNSSPVKRHQNDSDSDLSPRRADKTQKTTVHNESRQKTAGKATKTLSGAQAGLQLAADMRKESQELRRRENASFAKACFIVCIMMHLLKT